LDEEVQSVVILGRRGHGELGLARMFCRSDFDARAAAVAVLLKGSEQFTGPKSL